ncbi:hypothetical protein D9758_004287 [Tetrapyrgos nigripes]|uniref:DEAD/DEAH-box helicase domain-containing protein n=1 Tax=Tetrapyrgos nigripes TaxID=182062 RepID=A0A8H5LV90_9AGAR|nr:hypothetical protein D9758_004287 [Tetrapyrgos nigripes]
MPAATTTDQTRTSSWDIKDLVYQKTQKKPCLWQVKTALSIYNGKNVVGVARTDAGKTLSFWIPLMMAEANGKTGTAVVVTPLNLLEISNFGGSADFDAGTVPPAYGEGPQTSHHLIGCRLKLLANN